MENINIEEYDLDSLREKLFADYLGEEGVMTRCETPFGDWVDYSTLSDKQVIKEAISRGYDLNNYKKDRHIK